MKHLEKTLHSLNYFNHLKSFNKMNFLHALCSVVLLSIFLFNITSCKTASYTRSFKDGNDDKSYAISGSEKASGTIAYSEDFTFLESLMFWKKIRRWYGTYTIKTKAVSEKLELKGKIVGSMNFLEGQLGDKTFEYYESPNAPAPFIAATLTVANDKKYLLQQVEELHWNINNADKDEKAIENYPHEIPATSKIQITDEENVVFAEFDMGTSKNSLSESFSRFLQVVSRYNSATYNIAFSKLPLKTEVFRGSHISNKTFTVYDTADEDDELYSRELIGTFFAWKKFTAYCEEQTNSENEN